MIILKLFHRKKMKRRAIAQIVGTLMMVAVVTSVGGLLLFQGMTAINNFNNYIANSLQLSTASAQESFIIEHVKFDPTPNSKRIDFWIRNTGTVDLTIERIAVVRVDTQELVLYDINVGETVGMTAMEQIIYTTAGGKVNIQTDWLSIGEAVNYKISVTTAQGNSKETTAAPYNT